MQIITGNELQDKLQIGKTKFNALLQADVLPVVKIGRDYITTDTAIEKWVNENIGKEIYY